MPFGHGVFADIKKEEQLNPLWHQRLRRMLYRPLLGPHPFAEVIDKAFPWSNAAYRVPDTAAAAG